MRYAIIAAMDVRDKTAFKTVFSFPGLGTLSYESARYKDYNLLMVLCMLSGAVVILCSLAAQTVNERVDPRMAGAGRTVLK